jgi:hypothetical protein
LIVDEVGTATRAACKSAMNGFDHVIHVTYYIYGRLSLCKQILTSTT